MQTKADDSCCTVTSLANNAINFIGPFKALHIESHQYALNIQDIYDIIGVRIDYLQCILRTHDALTVQCELENFLDYFLCTAQPIAETNIQKLIDSCNDLLQQGQSFECANDLSCGKIRSGERGCAATLNELKSTLAQFLTALQKAYDEASGYVGGISKYCTEIGCQAENYSTLTGPSWQLKLSLSSFLSTLRNNYKNVRSNSKCLLELCDELATSINTLEAKILIAQSCCCVQTC